MTTTFTIIVILAARTGSMRRAVTALCRVPRSLVLIFTFARGVLEEKASSSSDPLVTHQLSGLADPFNQNNRHFPTHLAMFQNGFRSGCWIRSVTGSHRRPWRGRPSAAAKSNTTPRSTSRISSSR